MLTFEDLQQLVEQFAAERDWDKYHTPKNLAMAMSIEAAEVMEHFQWLNEEQSHQLNEDQKREVAHELSDVLVYLVRLANKLDIDLSEAVTEKMKINAEKYPADKVKGSAVKYTHYKNQK